MYVYINGQKVAYLKRVAHGEPVIKLANEGEHVLRYSEKVAKGWVNTLIRYGYAAEAKSV